MIKACLFDLDGTLLNTLESIRHYINKNLAMRGIGGLTLDETRVFVGTGAMKLCENALRSKGVDLMSEEGITLRGEIYDSYVREYNDNPCYLTEAYLGIAETVAKLKEKQIKLAVISNKPDATVKQLVAEYFSGEFEIIEGASEKFPLKPDPLWPSSICERLGVDPAEVMYLGDTSTDMQTARAFGAGLAVGVSWGFREREELVSHGADVVIDHPSEILGLLEAGEK